MSEAESALRGLAAPTATDRRRCQRLVPGKARQAAAGRDRRAIGRPPEPWEDHATALSSPRSRKPPTDDAGAGGQAHTSLPARLKAFALGVMVSALRDAKLGAGAAMNTMAGAIVTVMLSS